MWESGFYKILLTVTNDEEISTTGGTMLIRMPSPEMTSTDADAPALSKGQDTETSSVGIWGIVMLSAVLGIAVFVLMMKSPEDDELFGGLLNDMGEPDSEGLPTHVDENGMLWRKHDNGEVDWWDRSSMMWKRW
tara:strand:- start:250 stop:651 length:402 start_codon:yes stop_codon:yes gene_type:complete